MNFVMERESGLKKLPTIRDLDLSREEGQAILSLLIKKKIVRSKSELKRVTLETLVNTVTENDLLGVRGCTHGNVAMIQIHLKHHKLQLD